MERVAQCGEPGDVPGRHQVVDPELLLGPADAVVEQEDVAPRLVGVEVDARLEAAGELGEAGEGGSLPLQRAGDDQRDARLVDEDRVGLVDQGEVQRAVDLLGAVDRQAVAQQVEAGLPGGQVGDVAGVGALPLRRGHPLLDDADLEPQQAVGRAHPRRVAARQVVVEGEDVGATAGQRPQEGGRHRGQRLALAGRHLGELPRGQRQPAGDLLVVGAQAEGAAGRLPRQGEALDQVGVGERSRSVPGGGHAAAEGGGALDERGRAEVAELGVAGADGGHQVAPCREAVDRPGGEQLADPAEHGASLTRRLNVPAALPYDRLPSRALAWRP